MQKAVNCTTVWNLKRPNIYQMTIIRDLIGESNGTPLQYSCLENPMDGGAWWAAVHGVAKSWIWWSDFTFHFHALGKEMATHFSVLAWRIPGTGEPGGLPSMGSHRVGHWKVVVESRHRDSWPPEEKNSIWGQRWGLIAQSFCVVKFY